MKTFVLAQSAAQMHALCGIARSAEGAVEAVALNAEAAAAAQADKVWVVEEQAGAMVEDYTESIAALINEQQPSLVIIEQSIRMRVIAGRLGALLGTSGMDGVTEFAADGTVKHLVYGGTAVRQERPTGSVALLLLDATQFDAVEPSGANEQATFAYVEPASKVKCVSVQQKPASDCNLAEAAVVVGIGRGIAEEKDMEMVRAFAAAVKGELGCTRPVAEEEKWLPRETYIGVSGITLSPEVYFAVGLSGQVQHTIGINRSGKIIAINKDKNAIIFKSCDLGIVGDLYKVLPAVTEALA